MNEDESRKRDHSPLAAKNGRRTIWVPTTRQKKNNNKTLPINWLITAAIKCASCLYATLLLPSIDTFLGHIEREGWSRSSTIGRFLLLCFSSFCGEKLTAHVGRPNSRGHLNSQNFFFLSQTVDAAADATVCVCIYLSVADGGSHHYTQLPDHPNRRGVVVVVLCRELGREIRATSFDIHHHGVDCSIDLHRDVSESGFLGGGLDDLHH